MASDPIIVYGATGFTGRVVVRAMRELGLRPVLGGRDESRLQALAGSLGLECRPARLDDPVALDAALRDLRVVLHAAGPFSETARPMVDACLRGGLHYLDVTGEAAVLEALAQRHAEAKARGVMLLPAVGFDVVPSDCLAAHVASRLPGARRLAIGLAGLRAISRGSLRTLFEHLQSHRLVRRDGRLVPVPNGALERRFDYGDGPRLSLNVTWGDVVTAYYTTGIPNIETYFEANPLLHASLIGGTYFSRLLMSGPGQAWLKALAEFLPAGPSEEDLATIRTAIVAEVEDETGRRASARLRAPDGYTLTGHAAAEIVRRVVRGDLEPGFQTPARLLGADFVLTLPGVSREDLA